MSQRKIFIDAFFHHFAEFMDQLTHVFPMDPDFHAYKMGIQLFHKTNPSIVLNAIRDHVFPFEKTIRDKNDDFFAKNEFKDYADDDAVMSVIRKLQNLWQSLSVKNREVVWTYIILLLDLAKKTSQ
jgi:hypothetical protein